MCRGCGSLISTWARYVAVWCQAQYQCRLAPDIPDRRRQRGPAPGLPRRWPPPRVDRLQNWCTMNRDGGNSGPASGREGGESREQATGGVVV